jgi:hypothetical protein
VQARPARCLASTASGNIRRHHGVVIGAQARSTARCKLIVEVLRVKVKQVDRPGNLGTLVLGGGQSEGPKERQSGVVKVDSSLRGKVH